MSDAISLDAQGRALSLATLRERARVSAPTRAEVGLATLSAVLLIISFPDFNLWPLAWVALVPLLICIARRPRSTPAFIAGLITGAPFFLGSCYWLTYAMVRYGGIPAPIAYLLLVPGAIVVGLFPALFSLVMSRVVARWGVRALLLSPFAWVASEWARLAVTGQLWNAIGYSQAYHPSLIQAARWGGVYAVGFLILMVNAALAYLFLERNGRALVIASLILLTAFAVVLGSHLSALKASPQVLSKPDAVIIAVQPDVPMETVKEVSEMDALITRHLSLSKGALDSWLADGATNNGGSMLVNGDWAKDNSTQDRASIPRIVVWPESPMNFTYANDSEFRELVRGFTTQHHTAVLFNSLEPAPAGGAYNSAVLVNEEGRPIAQYDKIRLLPFGEYVPLPRWLPGVNLVPVMVGDFTPGAEYPLIPLGQARAGVFICFESAFPSIARRFADEGADVLINITNDGYLGRTPVMRQHLANTVFRAVENGRPVLRVTNTGITAYITGRGEILDETNGFEPAVRTWTASRASQGKTFYTKHGELFVLMCAALSLLIFVASFRRTSGMMRPKS